MANKTNSLVIKNTNILTMESDRILSNHDVFVTDEIITEIKPSGAMPVDPGSTVIDGTGKYTLPGLMDMHVHLWNEKEMLLYIANGVTTVRNMWGAQMHFEWQKRIEQGELLCPNIYTTSPLMDGAPAIWPGSAVFNNVDEVNKTIPEYQKTGYKQLKIYNRLPKDIYDAIVEQGLSLNLPVVGHVSNILGLYYILQKKQKCIEHLDGFILALSFKENDQPPVFKDFIEDYIKMFNNMDKSRMPEIADRVVQAGTWACPTLVVMTPFALDEQKKLLERPANKYVMPSTLQSWDPAKWPYAQNMDQRLIDSRKIDIELTAEYVGLLKEAGGRILAGTDTPNPQVIQGFSMHDELVKLVAAGLTPYEAIRSCTRDGAEFMNTLDEVGTISTGKRADLLMLNENPFENISSTRNRYGVVFRGKWLPQQKLDQMLEELRESFGKEEDPHTILEKEYAFKETGKIYKYDAFNADIRVRGEQLNIRTFPDEIIYEAKGIQENQYMECVLHFKPDYSFKEGHVNSKSQAGEFLIDFVKNEKQIVSTGKNAAGKTYENKMDVDTEEINLLSMDMGIGFFNYFGNILLNMNITDEITLPVLNPATEQQIMKGTVNVKLLKSKEDYRGLHDIDQWIKQDDPVYNHYSLMVNYPNADLRAVMRIRKNDRIVDFYRMYSRFGYADFRLVE